MVGASELALINRLQLLGQTEAEYKTEAELLAACRRRDIRAFEQVYLAHGPRLKSMAYHILGSRPDAEDAVQETFLKLYRGIHGFHGQSSIGTWLCRILINTAYDVARKRQRERAPVGPLVESVARQNHLALNVALDDALRRIHPKHRMVFLLFEVEGLRHAEIAAILEVPEGTSKAWLFEAKKELKQLLMEIPR
ncbi:MAG TPA: RNA polymerase sigma factor [Candidatus Acidoferrales bacterium]|jgi:RNA polymerase sigma-70 factor (ECF subfamily)|nr:RNA polymerase sigma factor [Candidatus Acidoferrales bacterium]